MAIIKESDNEYTEIDEINHEKEKESIIDEKEKNIKNEHIINQAIEFIIQDKVTQFNEYI